MTVAARTKYVRAILLALTVVSLGQGAVDKKPGVIVFPGKSSNYPSPDGRYMLVNVDDASMNPPHKLLLRDNKTGGETTLLSYNRWVGVLWSPSGSALLVNDHKESDEADVYVFTLDPSTHRVSMLDQLRHDFPGDPSLFQNDHVYIEATAWITEKKIEVKAYGHGDVDPKGFTNFFEYTLGDHVQRVRSN
jgi:hypothetical protein